MNWARSPYNKSFFKDTKNLEPNLIVRVKKFKGKGCKSVYNPAIPTEHAGTDFCFKEQKKFQVCNTGVRDLEEQNIKRKHVNKKKNQTRTIISECNCFKVYFNSTKTTLTTKKHIL